MAFFVTAHGFGHAARAAAIMAAIRRIQPAARFDAYTTVPAWFFQDMAVAPVAVRCLETDVGMVQKTPLLEDPEETLRRLSAFFPLADSYVRGLAGELSRDGVNVVVSDIAATGIAAAAMAGIPSVLIENFTWDWIYAPYTDRWPGFERHIRYLAGWFERADVHIQADPVCSPAAGHLRVPPVSREARTPPQAVRTRLGIGEGERMVLLTLGGTPVTPHMLSVLQVPEGFRLVAPGAPESLDGLPRVVRLPVNSGYFHPDLIRAADAVIGKAGYSTLAEIHRYGVPFGYVSRPHFREAPIMESFIREEMACRQVPEAEFLSGDWSALMADLVAISPRPATVANGADTIARFVTARFGAGAPVTAG